MRIYNRITHELFNRFNFEKPTLFRYAKRHIRIYKSSYCYVFPQQIHTWHGNWKYETTYYILFWRIIVNHTFNAFTGTKAYPEPNTIQKTKVLDILDNFHEWCKQSIEEMEREHPEWKGGHE